MPKCCFEKPSTLTISDSSKAQNLYFAYTSKMVISQKQYSNITLVSSVVVAA